MKGLIISCIIILLLTSCRNDNDVPDVWISFKIPDSFIEINTPENITVNWENVELSGELLQVWDTLVDAELDMRSDYFDNVETTTLSDFSWYKLIETVPSLDTPVCTMQTQQLEFAAEKFQDISFIVISNDTPFALQRFCSENNINNLIVLSDARTREFGQKNSLFLTKYSLLTRTIMIVDENNLILYIEYADEVTSELDLMNALAFLTSIQ